MTKLHLIGAGLLVAGAFMVGARETGVRGDRDG